MSMRQALASIVRYGIAVSALGATSTSLAATDGQPATQDVPGGSGQRDADPPAHAQGSWARWRGVTGATRERQSEPATTAAPAPASEPQRWYRWSTSTGGERAAAAAATAAAQAESDAARQAGTEPPRDDDSDRPADPFMTGWWSSWTGPAPERTAGPPVPGGPSVAQRAEERAALHQEGDKRGASVRFGGYAEFASAYAFDSPGHWSKLRARVDVAASGLTAGGQGFKFGVRGDVDAAYLNDRHYPQAVRRDQRSDAMIREAYLDFDADKWAFRLGRQHVVWGEAVGMFIADVVSARDTREFSLGEFDAMRIPQWAARAEHFGESSHLEFIWIPYPSYDEFGEPGADFHPFPGLDLTGIPVRHVKPGHSLAETNWGLRASRLWKGWDMSAFFYRSNDTSPVLLTTDTGFELHHDRISQLGATFSKDVGTFVLKGEAVHTDGRRYMSTDPAAPLGVKPSSAIDYVVGVDIPRGEWRLNAQIFGRQMLDHDPSFPFDRSETGYTLLFNRQLGSRFEVEAMYASSFNRSDYMLRPRVVWNIMQQWRAAFGLDLFGGSEHGVFGRYRNNDRVYLETRYWF